MINNQLLFVELSEDDEPYSFKLVFHGPSDRTFTLGAENQEVMEEWMKAIAAASYDYMKLLVMELQRQVDELTGKLFQVIVIFFQH
jgi:sesquipedalian